MIGPENKLPDFVPRPELYRYVLCWNGGQASYDTLNAALVAIRDRAERGEAVHLYPMLKGGA